jgi:hypothetical protein
MNAIGEFPSPHTGCDDFGLMTAATSQSVKGQKHDDRHFCCGALCQAHRKPYDGLADWRSG